MTTALFIFAILVGFTVLIWGADRFVEGASSIATNLGVSPLLVGLTIVAFGTSAPEMLVSALAAYDGVPSLGVGNALGSNITNIGLVLGVTILITPITVNSDILRREFPVLFIVMAISLYLLWDLKLSHIDGLILFCGFILTLFGMAYLALHGNQKDTLTKEFEQEVSEHTMPISQAFFYFIIGLVALLIGSKSLVWGGTGVAQLLGVSELIIGLTIVAIGTSLPELAASVISALKNKHDIAIGNVLGSNMFNLLAVLAMPGLIRPSEIDPMVLLRDFPFMIALTLALFFFALRSQRKIGRFSGALMLFTYIGYNALLAYQSTQGSI